MLTILFLMKRIRSARKRAYKLNLEIRKRMNVLNGKVGIAFDKLPLATFVRKETDFLNTQILKRLNDLHFKIGIIFNNFHAPIQRNRVTATVLCNLSGTNHCQR